MRCCGGAGLVILLTFVAVPTRSDDKDTIMIAQDPGDEQGVIIWGANSNGTLFKGLSVQVKNYPASAKDQVVAFTKGRPPAMKDVVVWTDGNDTVKLDYPPTFQVPVKFWVLCGTKDSKCKGIPPEKKTELAEFFVWANERLTAEHVGFTLSRADDDDWISDPTTGLAKNTVDTLMKFNERKCEDFDDAVSTIKQPDAINIYIVKTVDRKDNWGRQCSQNYDSAVVARNALEDTIFHEIGHVLSLEHTDGKTWFLDIGGEENLMSQISTSRKFVTEGQVFRMYFSTESGFSKDLASVLPNQVTSNGPPRDCTNTPLPCLHEEEMLWPDH